MPFLPLLHGSKKWLYCKGNDKSWMDPFSTSMMGFDLTTSLRQGGLLAQETRRPEAPRRQATTMGEILDVEKNSRWR